MFRESYRGNAVTALPFDPSKVSDADGTTATGESMIYRDPNSTRVRSHDLYLHLSRMCRYYGAVRWTVLDHLALCCLLATLAGYSRAMLKWVACHDLHEAYVGDVASGLKGYLADFKAIELAWEVRVHHAFGLDWRAAHPSVTALVKRVDLRALAVEVQYASPEMRERVRRKVGSRIGGPLTWRDRACWHVVRVLPNRVLWEIVRTCTGDPS